MHRPSDQLLIDAVSALLVPLPWPIWLAFAVVLGGIAIPFLLHLTEDRSSSSLNLREGVLGAAFLVAVAAMLIWMVVVAAQYCRLPPNEQSPNGVLVVTVIGLVNAVCWFGIATFVATAVQVAWRLFTAEGQRRASQAAQSAEQRRRQWEQQTEQRRASDRQKIEATEAARRDAARMACQLTYDLFAPDIQARFSRSQFQHYLSVNLHDRLAPQEFERRSVQLQQLIHQHVEKSAPQARYRTLDDVRRWYEEQCQRLQNVPDERLRRTLHAQLRERYATLATSILDGVDP